MLSPQRFFPGSLGSLPGITFLRYHALPTLSPVSTFPQLLGKTLLLNTITMHLCGA